MDYQYGICRVAVAPLRADPSDRAEIVSQLLFGDHVEIIQREERWWLIENAYDGYQGWMDFRQLTAINEAEFTAVHDSRWYAPLSFHNVLTADDGSLYHLSPGSNLPNYDGHSCQLGKEHYTVGFTPQDAEKADFKSDIVSTAQFFRNVPYLWGGRHLFGMDCSGFVQTVFKLLNIRLKRDAAQQAEQGELVGFLSECKAGDVAFFDNEDGKITHVGIMLNPSEIIHASAKVKIDPIDNQGIFNRELGVYSHKLRIIKRFVE